MRPEMKSTQNEISTRQKRNFVYITFHCEQNQMKFRFGGVPRKATHSIKANDFCFDEIDVQMFSLL